MAYYKRYKRAKVNYVVPDAEGNLHENVINLNLYRNGDEIVVHLEGYTYEVEFNEKKKYWQFKEVK